MKNKNKSKDGELHKCDFCGSQDDLWTGLEVDGQYCLEHFKASHSDPEEFEAWYRRFHEEINS